MDLRASLCRRLAGTAAIAAALWLPTAAPAQSGTDAAPLTTLGDPLELARHVDEVGDDAVLSVLEQGGFAERLGAVRACAWLAEPERALGSLAALAAGDDPDLAPTAARAAAQIADRLRHDALRAREADFDLLEPAPWEALAADETARADLRGIGDRVAQALQRLTGSAAASP